MNSLAESTLDAIELMYNNAIQNSKNSKTIECKVIEKLDAGLGLYRVSYLGNDNIEAYASNASINYEKDDIVYVLIPEGNDFSKTKIILGAASPSGNMYVSNEESEYITLSENLIYGNEVRLCTYHNYRTPPEEGILENFNNDVFLDYLNKYKNFLFSAKIRTSIPIEQQSTGNYGVILKLPIIKDGGDGTTTIDDWASFYIDVNNIKGNPYRLDTYSLQSLYLQIPEDFNYDKNRKPRLEYFVQGFVQSASVTTADIFIKDVSFTVQDIITSDLVGKYYLSLVATEGNYFLESSALIKTIKPILKVSGKDSSVNGYDCYWFKENPKITYSDIGYTPEGGLGWECLNEKTNIEINDEGKTVFQYVLNSYSLDVNKEDVVSARKYKCVLVKNNIYISKELELKDLTSTYEMQLLSTVNSNTFVENTGKIELIARLAGYKDTDVVSTVWKRFDKNGNYLDDITNYNIINKKVQIDGKTWLETRVSYPCSYVENSNLIRCAFYCDFIKDGVQTQKMAATDEILIKVSSVDNYRIVFENGDLLYKYDADGDSPRISDYDGPASSVVKEIKPIGFKMYKSNGVELTETEYAYCKVVWTVPINSMFTKITDVSEQDTDNYYVKTKTLKYDIRSSFDYKRINKQILLTVTFGEDVINQYVPITFIKDGASGTNGTKFSGLITYQNQPYGTYNDNENLTKLQAIYINTKGWYYLNVDTKELDPWPATGVSVGIDVYGDGEKLASGYTVEWSMYDNKVTKPLFTMSGNKIIVTTNPWAGPDLEGKIGTSNIIQAKITITNNTLENRNDDVLYAYYPIEITYISKGNFNPEQLENTLIPNLTGGFEQVLYSQDGLNPKYDSTEPFTFSTNLEDTIDLDILNYQWRCVGNLDIKNSNNNICKIIPFSKKTESESVNYVQVRINYTDDTYKQVQKDLYGDSETGEKGKIKELEECNDEIENLEELIENISDVTPDVDNVENLGYNIYINDCLLKLDNCNTLVDYRSQMINLTMNNLIFLLNEVNNQCHTIEEQSSIKILLPIINKNNESITKIINANNVLFGLHNYTLNDIINLEDTKIIFNESDRSTCLNKYNVTSVAILDSDIEQYNNALNIYQSLYNSIKGLSNTDLDNYKNFISDCNNITNIIFNNLSEQEFKNLISQTNDLIKNIYTCNYINSPNIDYIKNEVLEKIRVLLSPYLNKAYIKNFEEQSLELKNQKSKLEHEKETLEGILNSGNTNSYILHSKPIITMYNRYEMSYLNDWDGNKLEISENEGYIVAPQIGAGAKNEDNTFTGITMGVKKKDDKSKIGLFGLSRGAQSIFLNAEDGSATFGTSGAGQILLEPGNKAIIKSGNYGEKNTEPTYEPVGYTYNKIPVNENWYVLINGSYVKTQDTIPYPGTQYYIRCQNSGMLIDLTTPEIKFGSGNFSVNDKGHLTAQGGGSIAGWDIGNTQISKNNLIIDSGTDHYNSEGTWLYKSYGLYTEGHDQIDAFGNGFYLSNNGLSIGSKTYISADGELRLGNGAVRNIGKHWKIGEETVPISTGGAETISVLKYNNKNEYNSVYISTKEITLGQKFYVDNAGVMRLGVNAVVPKEGAEAKQNKYWTIDGGTESYIAYGTTTWHEADSEDSQSNTVYIGTNGISVGKRFSISDKGALKAYSGEIGGWNISKNKLNADKLILNSDGSMEGGSDKAWSITKGGTATFSDMNINGGEININNQAFIYNNGNAVFNNITCNSVFSFSGGDNSFSNTGFSFNQASSSWNSTGFSGGGNASYSSTKSNPLDGTCVTQIDTLIATTVDATYVYGKIAGLDKVDVKVLTATGNISSASAIIANGGLYYGPEGQRVDVKAKIDAIDSILSGKADKGSRVTGSIKDSTGKDCVFTLNVE